MATKGKQIEELQEQNADLGEKLNGVTEIAGDLFFGLVLAAEKISEQQHVMEAQSFVLDLAEEVIDQQNVRINKLERADRRRQREQELSEKSAASLKSALDTDELTNWALRVSTTMAKGLVFTTTPDRYGRVMKTTTQIGEDGKMGATTSTTKGDATVTFEMSIFGKMEVSAKIRHVEVRDNPQSNEAFIRNEVKFAMKVNGTKRHVLVVSGGKVRQGYEWEYQNYEARSGFAQIFVDGEPYFCSSCGQYHPGGGDEFAAKVTTAAMPEPYRRSTRNTGGCGGY